MPRIVSLREPHRRHGTPPKDVRPIMRLSFLIPISISIPKLGPAFPGSPCRVTLTTLPRLHRRWWSQVIIRSNLHVTIAALVHADSAGVKSANAPRVSLIGLWVSYLRISSHSATSKLSRLSSSPDFPATDTTLLWWWLIALLK